MNISPHPRKNYRLKTSPVNTEAVSRWHPPIRANAVEMFERSSWAQRACFMEWHELHHAWYFSITFQLARYFPISVALQPLILPGICYMLVVQTLQRGVLSRSFRCHLGSVWGIFTFGGSLGFHVVSCRFGVSFGISVRFLSAVI